MGLFKSTPELEARDGLIILNLAEQKHKSIRGTQEIPAQAIKRVSRYENDVYLHIDGVVHPAPTAFNKFSHNRYAVRFFTGKGASEAIKKIEEQINAAHAYAIPADWKPLPQPDAIVQLAEKQSYEQWETKTDDKAKQRQEKAHAASKAANQAEAQKIERYGKTPTAGDHITAQFADVTTYSNHSIKFNGQHYSAIGAKASIDAGLANNKKFSAGRVITGAAAAPFIGVLALPALIRKQKGQLVLEIETADGDLLVTIGRVQDQKDALKVVQRISSAPRPAPKAPSIAPAAQSSSGETVDQLAKLAELHKSGALTDDEFSAAKASIIGG